MSNELTRPNTVQDLTEWEITQADAAKIDDYFVTIPDNVSQLDKVYHLIIKAAEGDVTEELAEQAKELSKKYGKVRTKLIDAGHKEAKHYALQFGKYCDQKKKDYYEIVKPREKELDKIADFFKEQQRLAKEELKLARLDILAKIDPDGDYKYSGVEDMDDNVFDHFVAGVEAKIAKAKADAKLLEEARIIKEKADKEAAIKDAQEKKELREENQRLQEQAALWKEAEKNKETIPEVIPDKPINMKELNDKHILTLLKEYYASVTERFPALIKSEKGKEIYDKTMIVNRKIIDYLTKEINLMED